MEKFLDRYSGSRWPQVIRPVGALRLRRRTNERRVNRKSVWIIHSEDNKLSGSISTKWTQSFDWHDFDFDRSARWAKVLTRIGHQLMKCNKKEKRKIPRKQLQIEKWNYPDLDEHRKEKRKPNRAFNSITLINNVTRAAARCGSKRAHQSVTRYCSWLRRRASFMSGSIVGQLARYHCYSYDSLSKFLFHFELKHNMPLFGQLVAGRSRDKSENTHANRVKKKHFL